MRRLLFGLTMAALALPLEVGAREPSGAKEMAQLAAKVAPQAWYPEGYYDVRIAAEAQMAEYPRALNEIVGNWGYGEETPYKAYDVIDCGAEWVPPADVDPVTARYGEVALEISRLRSELERLKYPHDTYAAPLLAYEKKRIEEAAKAPDPMAPERADDSVAEGEDAVTFAEDVYNPATDPIAILATTIDANRLRLAPKLPRVLVEGGCGAGEGGAVIVKTVPPAGEVWLVNAFAFKVCTRKQANPWDRMACKWNEIETGKEQSLNGRYVYQVRWPDGTERKGTREIIPDEESETAMTVTFRKTGS